MATLVNSAGETLATGTPAALTVTMVKAQRNTSHAKRLVPRGRDRYAEVSVRAAIRGDYVTDMGLRLLLSDAERDQWTREHPLPED